MSSLMKFAFLFTKLKRKKFGTDEAGTTKRNSLKVPSSLSLSLSLPFVVQWRRDLHKNRSDCIPESKFKHKPFSVWIRWHLSFISDGFGIGGLFTVWTSMKFTHRLVECSAFLVLSSFVERRNLSNFPEEDLCACEFLSKCTILISVCFSHFKGREINFLSTSGWEYN